MIFLAAAPSRRKESDRKNQRAPQPNPEAAAACCVSFVAGTCLTHKASSSGKFSCTSLPGKEGKHLSHFKEKEEGKTRLPYCPLEGQLHSKVLAYNLVSKTGLLKIQRRIFRIRTLEGIPGGHFYKRLELQCDDGTDQGSLV